MIDIGLHASIIKLAIAYTLLGAFIFTVAITCLSLIGFVNFVDKKQQNKLFATLVIELVVIGVGTFSSFLNFGAGAVQKDIQKPVLEKLVKAEEQTQAIGLKLQDSILQGLRPEAAALAEKFIEKAKENGIDIRLIAGYRSKEQQEELYARGRTKSGNRVTNAKFSVHNTGLAFDVAIIKGGKYIWEAPEYATLGTLGKQLGLIWGGDNRSFPDMNHFETESAKLLFQKIIEQDKKKMPE